MHEQKKGSEPAKVLSQTNDTTNKNARFALATLSKKITRRQLTTAGKDRPSLM
jgi:hypothetical protein